MQELRERLLRRQGVGGVLAERAAHHESRDKKRKLKQREYLNKRKRSGSESSSAGAGGLFSSASSRARGSLIMEQHETDPGALLGAGMRVIKRFLCARGGADSVDDQEAASVVNYLTSVSTERIPRQQWVCAQCGRCAQWRSVWMP